eukprot:m.857237 g.857237  ORF g.857237 m.857237 type:complete len:349 (-) comp23519_c0_seq23:2092-3138(-)
MPPIFDGHNDGSPALVMLEAIKSGDVQQCRRVIASDWCTPDTCCEIGSEKLSALHVAVIYGTIEIVNFFLDAGADIAVTTSSGQCPLHTAAAHDNAEMINLLVQRGVLVGAVDNGGNTPLHTAAIANNRRAIDELLTSNAVLDLANHMGQTPLILACGHHAKDAVQVLLNRGGNISARDRRHQLPLHHAVWTNDVPIARLLLAAGMSANATGVGARPILVGAAEKKNADMVELLLESNAKPDAVDPSTGQTALHRAAWADAFDVAQRLLTASVGNIDACDHNGDTPLHVAVRHGSVQATRLLTARGADKSLRNSDGHTAADVAAAVGLPGVGEYLEVAGQFGKEQVLV